MTNTLTNDQVHEALSSAYADLAATDDEVSVALATVDQEALAEVERARWTIAIWDRVSPINGIPAQTVLTSRSDIPQGAGDIYLLIRDGQVVYFQPHVPGSEGHEGIRAGEGIATAELHLAQIVSDVVAAEVVSRVAAQIEQAR